MGFRQTDGVRSELEYIKVALLALYKKGRLIITVPGNFMTAPYAANTRDYILLNYCIKSIIELPSRPISLNGMYILEIENNVPQSKVDFYSQSKFANMEEMIAAIRNRDASFKVDIELLRERWDAKYHDPQFNEIRKKYLSKDTIRLGDIACVIPGTIIRSEDRKEKGEYLILSPRLIVDSTINYSDERAFYTDANLENRRFSQAILVDGDIIVCISGRIKFFIFHQNDQKVVVGQHFCIIRSVEDKQRYLQLYFGTQLGEENFNLQAKMLSVGSSIAHLNPRTLSSFVIPNVTTLEMAAKMLESNNLINKIAMLFESEGWEVIKEYKPKTGVPIEFDIALKTRDRIVGVVETKRNHKLSREDKNRIIKLAERALRVGSIRFFILFINNAMYRYKDQEFYRIPEIPTPDNYKLYDKQKDFYIEDSTDRDIKEIPPGAAPVADQYLIYSALARIETKVDAIQKTVDKISEQIQELAGRILIYQELVEKQLNYAEDDLAEQERILKVFTDTCVERATEKIRSEYAVELYEDEKKKLIDSMGEGAWNKLDSDAQNFLISSKVMYAKLVGISEIVDYSGVCLLVTKALELELGKRFCQNYISYYKRTYPGRPGRENAPLPLINKYHKYIKAHDFTLGSFPFIVGSQFVDCISESDKENIKAKILEYVKQGLLKSYASSHNDEETLELLSDFVEDVERVRKDYRNPSAHTNALTKVSAKECFDLVLDVEKLLKRMLDAFDE